MLLNYILLVILLLLSFFFSGSETSIFSLSNLKLESIRREYPRRGLIISKLLDHPQKLLVTILICNTFVNIFITLLIIGILDNPILATVLTTFLILIIGEITPKTIAINIGASVSLLVSPILYILTIILAPFVYVFRKLTRFLVMINSEIFFSHVSEPVGYDTDEMIEVIKESVDNGILNKEESTILGNLIQFSEAEILRVSRPRNEIFSVSIDITLGELFELIKEKKYSRIPVWEDNEENIIGILYFKDILKVNGTKRKLSYYRNLLKKPYFVPDSIKAEQLLKYFQITHCHIAMVIDEYGSLSGIVTLEDILEAIIGNVVDKDDIKPLYYKYDNQIIEVEARMDLSEFNQVFKTDLKSEENFSIGGFLLEQIQRIPNAGEVFVFNNLKFKIIGALPNKIEKIMITKMKKRQHISRKKKNSYKKSG